MFSGKLFEYATRKTLFGKTNERLDTPLVVQRGLFEITHSRIPAGRGFRAQTS